MRLFIATPLSDHVVGCLDRLISRFAAQGGKVKWVRPGNIHLTLRFLGDTPEDQLPELRNLIDRTAASISPVETEAIRLGGFPNLNRPRVIWVGLAPSAEPLAKLAAQIEQELRRVCFKAEEKPFRAHLTLGRVKDSRDLAALLNFLKTYKFDPFPVTLDRLVLFQSVLTPKGPVYTRLHEALLGGVSQERFGG